jgi:hypothetical protein
MNVLMGSPLLTRILLLLALLPLPGILGASQGTGAGARVAVVISESRQDIDADGTKERIEIVMEQGERSKDTEPWCGQGEKWEGEFSIRVWKGGRLLSSQSLNDLMAPDTGQPGAGQAESLFFWTPRFSLAFADYNGDGQIDFNLGQYASCNGNQYQLFTIGPNGRISRLPVKDRVGFFISPPSKANSTRLIRATGGVVRFSFYDNSVGRRREGRYRWDGRQFVPVGEGRAGGGSGKPADR